MQRCWHVHAWRRPNFDQLVSDTSNIITAMVHCRRRSSTRSSCVPADRASVSRPSVSAPDPDRTAPSDYLLPTARCSDCTPMQDDDTRRPQQPSDVDVRGRPSAPPSVVYDRPTSAAVCRVAPPTSVISLDTEQLPWRCTAV